MKIVGDHNFCVRFSGQVSSSVSRRCCQSASLNVSKNVDMEPLLPLATFAILMDFEETNCIARHPLTLPNELECRCVAQLPSMMRRMRAGPNKTASGGAFYMIIPDRS